jgi:hypothetical protein
LFGSENTIRPTQTNIPQSRSDGNAALVWSGSTLIERVWSPAGMFLRSHGRSFELDALSLTAVFVNMSFSIALGAREMPNAHFCK